MARTQGTQAPNGDMDQMRYVNVTTVDAVGAATMTQLMIREVQVARDYLRKRVDEATDRSARNTWDVELIAAFIFDNATKTLYRYKVINRGAGLPALIVEEDAQ